MTGLVRQREKELSEERTLRLLQGCLTSLGALLGHTTVVGGFRRGLARAHLPRLRIHDLRHAAATLLLKDGVHPKVVQELLGHSSITVTLDTYSHVVPALHAEVAKRMHSILGLPDGSKLAAGSLSVVDEDESDDLGTGAI